jgi:putative SOS response-associated peptidase YedK
MSKANLQDLYDITSPGDELSPSYNVAPTQQVYGVLERPRSGDDSNGGDEPERELRALRWGWCRPGRKTPRSAAN